MLVIIALNVLGLAEFSTGYLEAGQSPEQHGRRVEDLGERRGVQGLQILGSAARDYKSLAAWVISLTLIVSAVSDNKMPISTVFKDVLPKSVIVTPGWPKSLGE